VQQLPRFWLIGLHEWPRDQTAGSRAARASRPSATVSYESAAGRVHAGYVAETNRLRAEHRAKVADARRESEAIDRRQMQILGYLNGGFGEVEAWKVEVRQNEMRRAELQALIAAATSQMSPPGLHPNMATVFEQKIRGLAAALEYEDIEQRQSARTTLRGFIDRIVIPPRDALLQSGWESRGDADRCRCSA